MTGTAGRPIIPAMRASPLPTRMTSAEFIDWALEQPAPRYELVEGEVVAMAPERDDHNLVKLNISVALRSAVAAARLPCRTYTDGMAVEIDEEHTYGPDAMVRCGDPLDPGALVVRDPLILVEVISRSSAGADSGKKFADYFRLPSVRHYLVVDPRRRTVVHHERSTGDTIVSRILREGPLRLEPPGIDLAVESFFEGL